MRSPDLVSTFRRRGPGEALVAAVAFLAGCVVYVTEPAPAPQPAPPAAVQPSPPPVVVHPPATIQPQPPAVTPMVVVPNLVGQNFESAEAILAASQLELGDVSYRQGPLPPGTVMDQEPDAGTIVSIGSRVSLRLAIEQAQAVVPDVIGKGLVQATIALRLAGLRVGQLSFQSVPGIPSPRVGAQSPMAGTLVAPGTEVALVVHNPSPKATVPSLSGRRQIDAIRLLNDAGLRLGSVTSAPHPTVPEGCVVSQNPQAGTLVDPGTAVSLVISSGTGLVVVPNVIGRTVAGAISELVKEGLRSHVEYRPSAGPPNRVISQDPQAGRQVERMTVVALVASKALPELQTVAVPDLVGERPGEANALLAAAGLAVGEVTRGAGKPGIVISQEPAAGTVVVRGTKVSYVVGALVPLPHPRPVTVPNVVGMKEAQALAAIRASGLEVGQVREAPSERAGEVIWQSPSGGTQAAPGTKVDIVVGRPQFVPRTVVVPNVVGMPRAQAEAALRAAALEPGVVREVPGAREGEVVAQSPAAGAEVRQGSKVDLTVSRGQAPPNMAVVPNVVGMKRGPAEVAIQKAGLEVGTVTEVPGREPNEVVFQTPPPLSHVPAGTKVNISVVRPHAEPALVAVPNVVGMTQPQAAAALRNAGLAVGTVREVPGAREGEVVGQSPPAGSQVPAGSKVDLSVAAGTPPSATVVVPNVVGMKRGAAEAALRRAGLEVGTITETPAGGQPNDVVAQSPQAGSQVPRGTRVNLTVVRPHSQGGGREKTEAPAQPAPNVVGMKREQAELAIGNAGLVLGQVTESPGGEKGVVLSQSPAPGSPLGPGAKIDLVVAQGAGGTVTVPNVVGMSVPQARAALKQAGLEPVVPPGPSGAFGGKPSRVAAQTPAANSNVPPGSKVVLSVGPEKK